MKKKKKLDKFAKRRIRLLLIIIILIISIFLIFNRKDRKEYDEYRIIIGDKYISLEDDIYVDTFNNIYLSKEDILQLYDPNIYYNQIENMLITTYNKHIAILKLNENKININGSDIDTQAGLIKFNDKIYLPFSEMGIVYDFEYEYSKETKTVIIDSISEEKSSGKVVKKSAKIKNNPKLFSSKIEKIKKDETVVVLESLDKYYKIRTEKGNVGYISKRKIGNVEKIRENMEDFQLKEFNFLQYNDINKDYSDIEISKTKEKGILLDAFNIKNFEIQDKINFSSENYSNYIKWAEDNEITVIATISCEDQIIEDFLNYEKRDKIIKELYTKLINNKINGVNIDFTNINDVNSFYRFLIELSPMFREAGIKTMVTYNTVLKEDKLNSIVDYVIK